MSRETKKRLTKDTFASKSKEISNLEFVLNFKELSKPKTCVNVSEWKNESTSGVTLKSSDLNQLAADI